MLKNDEIFWHPGNDKNAARLSWGGSDGDFERLWDHSNNKWKSIVRTLQDSALPAPAGKIVEFGPGMGLLDDLLDQTTTEFLMLDHTDAYIGERTRSLSARCRHVLFTRDNLEDLLQKEAGCWDWLLSISVFYHVDDATAVALILELGKLLKPGGYVLIYGSNVSTPEMLRERGTLERLFARYPQYFINWDLVKSSLVPDYREVHRSGFVVYQKTRTETHPAPEPRKSFWRRLGHSGFTFRSPRLYQSMKNYFNGRF
jgi:2-polyprenyl-3-methyl-5-hydroxy-6-metoxy-1,4-benzoquinol methylase